MKFLLSPTKSLPEYQSLHSAVTAGRLPAAATGLSLIHKTNLTYTLAAETGRRVIFVASDEAEATRAAEDFTAFGITPLMFPARDFTLRNVEGRSREYEQIRLDVMSRMLFEGYEIIITTIDAAAQYTVPPEILHSRIIKVKNGQEISPDKIISALISSGYELTEQVEGPGQFARRGGLIDFYTPGFGSPVRIEFWGDEIDSIRTFSTEDQRHRETLTEIKITPAAEVIYNPRELSEKIRKFAENAKIKSTEVRQMLQKDADTLESGLSLRSSDKYISLCFPKPATLFDYAEDALLIFSETAKLKERMRTSQWQISQDAMQLLEEEQIAPGLDKYMLDEAELLRLYEENDSLFFDTFARGSYEIRLRELIHFTLRQLSPINAGTEIIAEDARAALEAGYSCVILAGTQRAAETLAADLSEYHEIPAIFAPSPSEILKRQALVTTGGLSAGYDFPGAKFMLLTCGKSQTKGGIKRKKRNAAEIIGSLDELKAGDYVVHNSHGIGVFDGIHKIETEGIVKDYIKIKYAKSDVLYVPVTQLDLVSKYIGPREDSGIRLHSLGGTQWQKTKSRVRGAVKDMAKELTVLYAKRMSQPGHKFTEDSEFQYDFERRFEFDETDDQMRCVEEIKSDMERTVPMDRLLCGDVGFGKTEVALRAAFKCIADGKQCALLVPTTILAWQHFQTISKRFSHFPVNAELLSRFRTPKQQGEIIDKLRRGDIDMVVGTHRLVSKDVKFRDLGLIIIDEEQRFGVAQKERLKELFPSVDVLTLSATPIPRTLNMAMSGLRDMSVIEEAPQDRHPVQTYVLEYDTGIVTDAIRRELRRGGQVYYLHNRTESIDRTASRLLNLIPEARIGTAHGKMSEEELSNVWKKLLDHEIDILVCTTIIETGVDVSNVNTLIIENCDHMGLSQLHQLRGRVGRSTRRAYAYLTFHRGKALSEISAKRLEAIREFTEFGSGFKIAMRDLEIRGAGNILGGEQHGHMESVGYDMYLRMLSDAIAEEKGEQKSRKSYECTVDLQLTAHIPEEYIPSLNQRLGIYRRIADIKNEEGAMDVTDELLDRFGDPPPAVTGLINIALLRNRAAEFGINEIVQKNDSLLLYPQELSMETAGALAAEMRGRVMISAAAKPYISVRQNKGQQPADTLKEILDAADTLSIRFGGRGDRAVSTLRGWH